MSTLKKILALTLALAMVLSLNVFAAFKDQDQIDEDCVSACTLMDDLGVLKGDNGNMKPEAPITRAEVATMIYRVMNKGKDDASNYKGMKLFTDVKEGKWYEGYINYCATMGLVSGVGNNKFNPNGNVKGTEVLKMLLGCLGYKGEGAKFTGSGWANRVIAQADEIGLIDEYAPALTVNAPRQWVAYLFANAMDCKMVKWSKIFEEFEVPEGAKTLGKAKFDLETLTGVVTAIDYNEEEDKPEVAFTVQPATGDAKNFTKFAIDTALYGQQVKVNYKATDKVYGVTATGKSVVKTVNVADLKGTYTASSTTYKLTADTELKAEADVWNALIAGDRYATVENNKLTGNKLPGTITLVASDGKTWDRWYATTAEYGTYTVNNKGKVAVDWATSNDDDPMTTEEFAKAYNVVGELADKDYVKGTGVDYFNLAAEAAAEVDQFGKLFTVEKLEKQTLKLTQVKNGAYTLGGTAYKQMKGVVALNDAAVGEKYDVYVDGGLIVKAGPAAGETVTKLSENLALLLATKDGDSDGWTGSTASDGMVRVLLLNGETKEFAYSNAAGKATFATVKTNGKDKVYEYVLNDDGTISFKTAITDPGDKYDMEATIVINSAVVLKNNYVTGNNGVRFDKNAKFFVKDTTKGEDKAVYAVMTMADFTGDFEFAAEAKMVKYNDGKTIPTYIAGFMTFAYDTVTTDAVYAIAQDTQYTTMVDDKTKTVVDVALKDGTTTMLTLADAGVATKNVVYTYTVTDGTATLTSVTMPTKSGTKLEYVAGNEIKLDDETELLTVADDAIVIIQTADGVAFKTLADVEVKTGYTTTVLYKKDSKGEKIAVLLVNFEQ